MTAQIIDGLALAHKLRRGLKQRAERLAAAGMRPVLAVILAGGARPGPGPAPAAG
jgi:5,10-methylene-tetrahydrofolate dehydrogenase/methenyl tetrahydrofolate cyclohydrolase